MLEVGGPAIGPNYTKSLCNPGRMTFTESQGAFGLWCVLSSPLILGLDVSNMTDYDTYWPIISNTRALAINQAWAGEAGHLVQVSTTTQAVPRIYHGSACEASSPNVTLPVWTVWGKTVSPGTFAIIALNFGDEPVVGIEVPVADMGLPQQPFPPTAMLSCTEVWSGQRCAPVQGVWEVPTLARHASIFYIFSVQQ